MVIKNAVICDLNRYEKLDIEIRDKKIFKIDNNIDSKEYIDAEGLILMPSIVDLNVKTFNKNLTLKTLSKLSKEAISSGVSDILLMPNLNLPVDKESVIEFVKSKSKSINLIKIHTSINALKESGKLSNIAIMIQKGAKAIFTNSDIDTNLLKRVFEYSKMSETTLICNSHNREVALDGVVNDSEIGFKLGLDTIAKVCETIEVAKVCELAKYLNIDILLQNLSTSRSIELTKNFDNITTEVSIHHLIANDNKCNDFNTFAKIMPPLREESERGKLIEALKKDEIDILTSLHSPISKDNKDLAFSEASFGIDSIKNYFPLCYTHLVKKDIISLQKLSKLISYNPSKALNLNSGEIKEGMKANFMLVDLNSKRKIDDKNSIYKNQELYGEIKSTIINGKIKYELLNQE